jgi:hypothetical protein
VTRPAIALHHFRTPTQPKEAPMAKGQIRSNREIRKPKKTVAKGKGPALSSVTSAFAKPANQSAKKR